MNIALMSHDNKKELMVQFCTAYAGILSQHSLYATNATGHMVADATGLNVHCFLSYAHGGSQQIGARIAYNEFDLVLFFNDPSNESMAGDVSYISRLCDQNNIPRPEQHPLRQQHRHGGDAGAGPGPGRSGLAVHRQSLQPSHRLTFVPRGSTINQKGTAQMPQQYSNPPAPQRGTRR